MASLGSVCSSSPATGPVPPWPRRTRHRRRPQARPPPAAGARAGPVRGPAAAAAAAAAPASARAQQPRCCRLGRQNGAVPDTASAAVAARPLARPSHRLVGRSRRLRRRPGRGRADTAEAALKDAVAQTTSLAPGRERACRLRHEPDCASSHRLSIRRRQAGCGGAAFAGLQRRIGHPIWASMMPLPLLPSSWCRAKTQWWWRTCGLWDSRRCPSPWPRPPARAHPLLCATRTASSAARQRALTRAQQLPCTPPDLHDALHGFAGRDGASARILIRRRALGQGAPGVRARRRW